MSSDPRLRLASRTANPTPPPPPPPPPLLEAAPTSISNVDGPVDAPNPTTTAPTQTSTASTDSPFKLKFCTVCASNNNRSMEAHLRLATSTHNYPVISFGTGSLVRLPGPSISQPQVYHFNTSSYDQMHDDLLAQDARLYRQNGILNMLDRNRHIKWGPERFQDWIPGDPRLSFQEKGDKGSLGTEGGVVDVIFTCEERCWDAVIDHLNDRGAPLNRPVHVVNVDIRDNHEEALVGGGAILELADRLNEAAEKERMLAGGWQNGDARPTGFDEKVPEILAEWQEKWPNLPALWTLAWL